MDHWRASPRLHAVNDLQRIMNDLHAIELNVIWGTASHLPQTQQENIHDSIRNQNHARLY